MSLLITLVIVYVQLLFRTAECDEVDSFLQEFDRKALNLTYNSFLASWIYNTNITDANQRNATIWETILSDFRRDYAEKAAKLDESRFRNRLDIARQIKFVKAIGYNLTTDNLMIRSTLLGNMTAVYGKATVCGFQERETSGRTDYVQNCSLKWALEPELTKFLKQNRNYEALQLAWKSWHDAAGKPIKKTYKRFVDLSNKGAKANGFQDVGDFWRFAYDDPNFVTTVEKLFFQILPLYENLFTYVRSKFTSGIYKGKFQGPTMPAHIFGNMWAQEWVNMMDVLAPYPKKSRIDVTEQMKAQNYTVEQMFHLADQFFQSLGMKPMPPNFWRYSMLKKPKDGREVVCHASAWDSYLNDDVRIKMCTEIEMNDLITVHHEMGHVQYYLNYAQQPFLFRDGANPGFHEAIGDTISLSSGTPEHFKTIGLLPEYQPDPEQDINYLMSVALSKIAFLPFGFLVDTWRYKVYNGSSKFENWNEDWWKMRYDYQGVVPPVARQLDDFDPGAKFHIPVDSPYMSYFVSFIIQFQFYQALCRTKGHEGPLNHCDFYGDKKAGRKFAQALASGASRPWPDVMEQITGQRKMDAGPLLEYFRPLNDWLTKENRGQCFGWGKKWPDAVMATLSKPRC